MSVASVGVRSSSLSKFEVENIDNNKLILAQRCWEKWNEDHEHKSLNILRVGEMLLFDWNKSIMK